MLSSWMTEAIEGAVTSLYWGFSHHQCQQWRHSAIKHGFLNSPLRSLIQSFVLRVMQRWSESIHSLGPQSNIER